MSSGRVNNILLWVVLVICLVYVTLWFAGFRFPHVSAPDVVALQEDAQDEEPDADVKPVEEHPERDSGNFAVSVEQEKSVDDGRIPGAPLL